MSKFSRSLIAGSMLLAAASLTAPVWAQNAAPAAPAAPASPAQAAQPGLACGGFGEFVPQPWISKRPIISVYPAMPAAPVI